jgi:AAA ATPase domain
MGSPNPGGGKPPFIGREAELAVLVAGLDDARAGRGRFVALVGEAGIGKTRTLEEFVARAGLPDERIWRVFRSRTDTVARTLLFEKLFHRCRPDRPREPGRCLGGTMFHRPWNAYSMRAGRGWTRAGIQKSPTGVRKEHRTTMQGWLFGRNGIASAGEVDVRTTPLQRRRVATS